MVAAGEFFRYLWNDINHGLALFAACAVTVFWVVDYQMINTVTSTGAAWMTPTSQKCARW